MSVVERLELGLAFCKAHAWGQGADRQESITGEVKYCARGAVIFGGFADETESTWCLDRAAWHKGPCSDVDDFCGNTEYHDPADWFGAMEALNDGAIAVEGRWIIATEYNDAIDRTKDDVILMFEAAIEAVKDANL